MPAPKKTTSAPIAPEGRPRAVLHEALNMQATRLREQDATIRRQAALLEMTAVRSSVLERQMAFLARVAGVENELGSISRPVQAHYASLQKQADEMNPAQPVPSPAPEAPAVTTQEARDPDGMDDVQQMGASPITDVSADAVEDVNSPYGTAAFEPLDLNELDVTRPVAGTETMRPPEETITHPDVRIGNPDDPRPAFPWAIGQPYAGPSVGGGAVQSSKSTENSSARALGSIRLARLRIQAGIADSSDDLELGSRIAASDLSDTAIMSEIKTLDAVSKAAANKGLQGPSTNRTTASRRLVPRQAGRNPEERNTPSMANADQGFERTASMTPSDEEFWNE